MINFDRVTGEDVQKHNPYWSQIPYIQNTSGRWVGKRKTE